MLIMLEDSPKPPEIPIPKIMSPVSLSDTKLGLSYNNQKVWFERDEQGRVNLIEIDQWLTTMFINEMKKAELRKSLGGK